MNHTFKKATMSPTSSNPAIAGSAPLPTPVDEAAPTWILKGLELSLDQNRVYVPYQPYGNRPLAGYGTRILSTKVDGDVLTIRLENERVFMLMLTEQ